MQACITLLSMSTWTSVYGAASIHDDPELMFIHYSGEDDPDFDKKSIGI